MNLFRLKRKSKKINPKRYLLLLFSLIMTTFAWFAYIKVLDTDLNLHLISWDIKFFVNGEEKTNPMNLSIRDMYPGMEDQIIDVLIQNNGQALTKVQYTINEVTLLGKTYTMTNDPLGVVSDTHLYVPNPIVDENGIATQSIINDPARFPFVVDITSSTDLPAESEGHLIIKVSWPGDNDELDTKWGYDIAEYYDTGVSAIQPLSMILRIDAIQKEEQEPYLPEGFKRVASATSTTGYTIQDSAGNKYVWIEVPKTLYNDASYNTYESEADKKPVSSTDYDNIEYCLRKYSAYYRESTKYVDEHPEEIVEANTGLTSGEYTALKQKMLKSVYENGGFYVGKYETGTATARNNATDALTTPVIKANAYPYNRVTCSQAQSLATGMASGEYTSSLMFGVQWNLVLKYLETKAVENGTKLETIQSEINESSTSWGNYKDNNWTITNKSSKYYISEWISGAYGPKDSTDMSILLSTGASDTFCKQGIYDLAGNVAEWTLEYTSNTEKPCAYRGGQYNNADSGSRANRHYSETASITYRYIGFRVSLF